MPAVTGISFIIEVESATPDTYNTVGGKRGATLNLGGNTADATSGDSAGWEENLPTTRNWSIEEDGVFIEDDAAYARLEALFFAGTQPKVRVSTPGGSTYTGTATITSLQLEGPHDDVSTVSISLQGSGALTKA